MPSLQGIFTIVILLLLVILVMALIISHMVGLIKVLENKNDSIQEKRVLENRETQGLMIEVSSSLKDVIQASESNQRTLAGKLHTTIEKIDKHYMLIDSRLELITGKYLNR